MEPKISFEDKHILVLDKPALMPTTSISGGILDTLDKWIVEKFPKQSKISADAGLINRLDNETSGIVVAARTKEAYEKLNEIWDKKEIVKIYSALVLGQTPARGKITTLIAHHPGKSNKMMVVDDKNLATKLKARFAETEYEIVETFLDYTLLRVRITTGVRHQIRVHLSSIGYPIAGDKLYRKIKHEGRDFLDLKRHFLHASNLELLHPNSKKPMKFDSCLPEDLEDSLKKLATF